VSDVDCMEEGMRVGGLGMVRPKLMSLLQHAKSVLCL
jgi:hypothetical protein